MPETHLNIISFDVPYPANYGGVIDVFCKLKALHKEGIKIHLHCFYKGEKTESTELEHLCEKINYYQRNTEWETFFSLKPYILKSRESDLLLQNLLQNDYPILFEGMHTTALIQHKKISQRLKLFRSCNIEHHYYWHLSMASENIMEKLFFIAESFKLKLYQPKLKHADFIFAITVKDLEYFKKHFPSKKTKLLPSFHRADKIGILSGKGNYAFYHGNLSVSENVRAVNFLIKKVFSKTEYQLKIAGLNPDRKLENLVSKHQNISLVKNPDDEVLLNLIQNAQFNLMFTFQSTGLKLKLLNSLNSGRYCIANNSMLAGSQLDSLCLKANSPIKILEIIEKMKDENFSEDQIQQRANILKNLYSNKKNTKLILDLL